jgi:signal transduction histidine kinase
VAVPAVERLKEWGGYSSKDLAILFYTIGCCQLNLGRKQEAANNYADAYQQYTQQIDASPTVHEINDAIVGTDNMALDYIKVRDFESAYQWVLRADSFLQRRFAESPDYHPELLDEYQARITLHLAIALQGLNREQEAAKAYRAVQSSAFGKTNEGLIRGADYLVAARRYQEAANNYAALDQLMHERSLSLSLDNIQNYLLPKFRANIKAGRTDSLYTLGWRLCDALDSAIVNDRNNEAAELATIYDTHQKEAMIAQQQADLSRQRLYGISIASFLILAFLAIYTYHRIMAQRRLALAYQKLEEANSQLEQKNEQLTIANARAEESSRMKTNFIQQISHEIRTPLNILSGFTQVITTPGMELDDATREDINRQICDNTDRITGLVGKMLELSDAGCSNEIERNDEVPLVQIAAQAAEDSGITQAQHLTFDLQLAEGAETVMLKTNLGAATRALTLILDNARKFTKPAEAFSGGNDHGNQTAVLRVSTDGEQALFTVEDSGIGVPTEEAERIFDEFVQLDQYYDGTGIGLTIARSLARRLKGDICLDTTFHPGARFVFSLPLTNKK